MNWTRAILAGLAAGAAVTAVDYVQHGIILRGTYERYPLFDTPEASPAYFLLVAVCISIFAAILFAKTRSCWSPGAKGGLTYGFWLGMVSFFSSFYSPLVLAGFPYFLAWCWGGANLIDALVGGAVLGLIYKPK